ncbi:hypothetical protein BDN67DRAFT_972391 [Paxillus ammoniavirescens]|nr:hypothetical protein BDN67DRAFT_972391 [Paxillus ammoniavirescens]
MAQNICHEPIDSTTGPIPQKQTRWLTTRSPSAAPKREDDPTMRWKGRKRRDTNEGTQQVEATRRLGEPRDKGTTTQGARWQGDRGTTRRQRTNDDRTGGTTRRGEINEGTTTRR